MYKNWIVVLTLGLFFSCKENDLNKEKLYVELKKNHEYYQKAQNQIDTNLKKTEEDLLKVKADVQKELGFYSVQYHQFDEDLKKFIGALEDKAGSHSDLLLEQSVLEDEIQQEKLKYEEALEKKKMIEKKREEIEKNFQMTLSSQDTLINKAYKLINKNS